MNKEKIPYSSFEVYMEDGKSGNLREIISKYTYHWPLFLSATILSLSFAFLYLKFSPPSYTVRAKLLVKDDEKGTGGEAALKELQLFKAGTLVENELEVLKSRSLMEKVVKDLELPIQYMVKDGFKFKDIYSESPVHLILLHPREILKAETIEIIVNDNKSFVLNENEKQTHVSFASKLTNQIGTWKLEPTANLSRYKGQTLKIIVNNPDIVTDSYVAKLNAGLSNPKATVIELSINESVPKRGKDILNSLLAAYNHTGLDDKNKVRRSTLNFIDTRLASLKGELSKVEKNVENFKSSKGLMDISSESEFFLDNVKDNDKKLNEVNVQLQVINGIERHINSFRNSGPAPAATGITDPALIALINQLMTLELKRDQLMDTAPEGSPVFEAVNRQISSTKQSIRGNIQGIKSSLLASRNQLMNNNNGFESSIRELPSQEREIVNIQRQRKIKEDLYVYLLQKREEAAVNYASANAENKTVDQAHVGAPEGSKNMITYGIALVAGIFLPFGLILGRNILNNRVLTAKEIQLATSVPVLAELVYQKSPSALVMQDKSRRMIAEQFRSLRTNLQYIYEQNKAGRVTLLTSGMSGEGKSFVSTNLGTALAISGRKTIILELDLRSPKIAKYMNLASGPGISDYLEGKNRIEEIIQPSGIQNNLFVAAAGTLPEFPAELIASTQMKQLMDWLSANFDEVLIDTPPIKLVTDAMILSRYSDVNLFIVRHGVTYKSQLEFIKQLFQEQKLKNLNIVFNGVSGSQNSAYQYEYYSDKNLSKKETLQVGIDNFLNRF